MTDLVFDDRGEGRPFVLLHPGGTDARALASLLAELGDGYRTITPDQRGHGRTPDTQKPFGFADMADDTIALIKQTVGAPVDLFGYSDGAILALYVALARPDLVRSVVFASAAAHRDGWLAGVLEADADPPEFMAESYGEVSPDGRAHWPVVVDKARRLHEIEPELTPADLAHLQMPVLVVQGDDDQVELEHGLAVYRALPDGELAVVPRTTHGLLIEKPALLAHIIRDFHDPEKSDGMAPMRRAS